MSSNPFIRSQPAQWIATQSALPRALLSESLMRAAGESYLPKWPMETVDSWRARLNSTFLYPGYSDACDTATGLALSEGVTLGDDVPEAIRGSDESGTSGLWENIDNAGTHGDVFCANAFGDALHCGVGHLLVEYPPVDGPLTLAEQRARGLRPYIVYVPGDAMLGWRFAVEGGRLRLVQFRFLETICEPSGAFGDVEVKRARVYYAADEENEFARYEVYTEGATEVGKSEPLIDESGSMRPHREIPVSTWYAGRRVAPLMAYPFFSGVASANLELWQSSSDQRTNLHMGRVSMFAFRGYTDEQAAKVQAIGPSVKINNPDPNSGIDVVGGNSEALGEGWKDMERLMGIIRERSMKPLLPESGGAETATGRSIDARREMSALERTMRSFQDALEGALGNMAIYLELPREQGGSAHLAQELSPEQPQTQEATLILDAYDKKLLSRKTALSEFSKKVTLSDDFDVDDELVALEDEANQSAASALGGDFTTGEADTTGGANGSGAASETTDKETI